MPIYAYRCTSCGHAKDVLQKVSDPLLTDCPACGGATFVKQVTAAGFQLKGSGWYVTDFRGGNNGAAKPEGDGKAAENAGTEKAGSDKPAADAAAPASTSSSPAPAPAPAAGGSSASSSPPPSPAAPPASGG